MATRAYRLVGPHPQATHFLCDAEAELPVSSCNGGDTAYAIDTGRLFRRGIAAWIESVPAGHVHGQAEVADLVPALSAKADLAAMTAALAARPVHAFARTTQDYTSTATALADIGELPVTVVVDTDYSFELVLFYQSAAVGCGVSLSMNGPAVAVGRSPVWESTIQTTGGPSSSALNVKAQLAANALHTTASVDAANTPRIARYFGVWPVGAAGGSLAPRFASEVASTQVKILRGSWFKVY